MKGRLYVISGPTAVGKGTLCSRLLEKRRDLILSISATTRQKRVGEEEGIAYYFKSKEEFEMMIKNKELLEYAVVHNHYYGTPKSFVGHWQDKGQSVILEIDTQGGLQIKKNDPDAVLIFVAPPDIQALKERIEHRGTETEDQIRMRLKNATLEFKNMQYYDYFVVNKDIEKATQDLASIIFAEEQRIKFHKELIEYFNERMM